MTQDEPFAEPSDEDDESEAPLSSMHAQVWDFPLTQKEKQKRLNIVLDSERLCEQQGREQLEEAYKREKGVRTAYEISNINKDRLLNAKTNTIRLQQQTIVDAVGLFRKLFDGKDLPADVQAIWDQIETSDPSNSTMQNLGGQEGSFRGETQSAHFQNLVYELHNAVRHLDAEQLVQVKGEAPRQASPKAKAKAAPRRQAAEEADEGLFGRAKGILGDVFSGWSTDSATWTAPAVEDPQLGN